MLHNMYAILMVGFKFTLKIGRWIWLEDKSLPESEVEHGPEMCPLWSKGLRWRILRRDTGKFHPVSVPERQRSFWKRPLSPLSLLGETCAKPVWQPGPMQVAAEKLTLIPGVRLSLLHVFLPEDALLETHSPFPPSCTFSRELWCLCWDAARPLCVPQL